MNYKKPYSDGNNRKINSGDQYNYNPYYTERNRFQGISSKRALNFEAYAANGNRFINEVAGELDVDRNQAARITRAVLHAVRDRIPPDDAIQFGQSLPMALKGVYIDQYDLSAGPIPIRNPDDFLDFIYMKDGKAAKSDFPTKWHTIAALKGVFHVLERNLDIQQVQHIKSMINTEIVELINE